MRIHLDRKQIEMLASNSEVFRRGSAVYKEGKVGDLVLNETVSPFGVMAEVKGSYDVYKVSVAFDGSGYLRKYACGCAAFGVWRGACKHVVGVLLKLLEQGRKQTITARRVTASRELLNQFERLAFGEIDESLAKNLPPVNPVSLEPTFILESGEIYLTLKIGRRRKYVVKDIAEFINDLRNENTVYYGKEFEFNHAAGAFDDKSLNLIKLIKDERGTFEKLNRANNKYGYYYSGGAAARRMPLAGPDRFFAMYNGQTVSADIDLLPAVKQLTLTDEPLPPVFKVAKREGGVMLSCIDEPVILVAGETGHYAVYKGLLHKIEKGAYGMLAPVFAAFKKTGERRVLFEEQEISRFSAFVLPKLTRYGLAVITEEFSERAANEAYSPKAYLDAENGAVTCRAVLVRDLLETDILYAEKASPVFAVEEYKLKALLARMGFVEENGRFVLNGDDNIYDFHFSEGGLNELRKNAEVFVSDAFKGITLKPKRQASFGLRISGALLEISVNTDFSKDELTDVLESYRLKKRFHRLKDGSFVDFNEPDGTLEAIGDLFEGLSLSDKDFKGGAAKVPKYRALYADGLINERGGLDVTVDEGFKRLTDDFKGYKELNFEIPQEVNHILRGYQKEGYKWLKTLVHYGFGGILADDMGLGKTLQVIAVLLSARLEGKGKREKVKGKREKVKGGGEEVIGVVVAPTSLIYNWEKEIHRFAPSLSAVVVTGTPEQRKELVNAAAQADVLITTYDTLKRDIDNYSGIKFKYIIADEAQNIKNPATQNAKAVKMLNGETRFALTGTPIENALSELWSIFDFVMPGYLYSPQKFAKTFEAPIIKDDDKDAADRLKRHIAPFILRRLKADVLTELPPKIETTLYAEMLPEQKKMYTAYLLKAKGELDDIIRGGTFNQSRIDILSKLTRLRQICCHPAVFAEGYKGGSGKLDLTLESIGNFLETGHRILIFSQFTSMLAIIRERLNEQGIEYFYLDGATDSKTRMGMTEAFNDGEGKVFLISLKAGGAGLNLTGADVVLHYDPWWNPAVTDQASDRAHRIGQQKTVQVFNIVAKDTIEEKMIALQEKKKNLVDSVITEGAQFINKMEQGDIERLFL